MEDCVQYAAGTLEYLVMPFGVANVPSNDEQRVVRAF